MLLKLRLIELGVPQNLREKTASYVFASMYRHDCGTTVGVLQVAVTTLGADDLKPKLLQGSDELLACNAGQVAQRDTVTRCTPTKRLVSTGLPSTSMQRAIAS